MSAGNFTPIAGKDSSKKKSSSNFKILGIISLFVMLVGVGVGYLMISQGFIFRPKAESRGNNLVRYGWNGSCFTKFSGSGIPDGIDHAALYQCPGKIGLYGGGCQTKNGKKLATWHYINNPLKKDGVSVVCIEPTGNSGPKDADGCFTQQLDLDDGKGGAPEGFYSYDDCKPSPTPTPTPTATPTPPPGSTPTPTPTPTPPLTITPTPPSNSTPTPTPPYCVEPGTPANVHINCPLCDQASSAQ